jgi:hypothetical protein
MLSSFKFKLLYERDEPYDMIIALMSISGDASASRLGSLSWRRVVANKSNTLHSDGVVDTGIGVNYL